MLKVRKSIKIKFTFTKRHCPFPPPSLQIRIQFISIVQDSLHISCEVLWRKIFQKYYIIFCIMLTRCVRMRARNYPSSISIRDSISLVSQNTRMLIDSEKTGLTAAFFARFISVDIFVLAHVHHAEPEMHRCKTNIVSHSQMKNLKCFKAGKSKRLRKNERSQRE